MRRVLGLLVSFVMLAAACGDDPPPTVEVGAGDTIDLSTSTTTDPPATTVAPTTTEPAPTTTAVDETAATTTTEPPATTTTVAPTTTLSDHEANLPSAEELRPLPTLIKADYREVNLVFATGDGVVGYDFVESWLFDAANEVRVIRQATDGTIYTTEVWQDESGFHTQVAAYTTDRERLVVEELDWMFDVALIDGREFIVGSAPYDPDTQTTALQAWSIDDGDQILYNLGDASSSEYAVQSVDVGDQGLVLASSLTDFTEFMYYVQASDTAAPEWSPTSSIPFDAPPSVMNAVWGHDGTVWWAEGPDYAVQPDGGYEQEPAAWYLYEMDPWNPDYVRTAWPVTDVVADTGVIAVHDIVDLPGYTVVSLTGVDENGLVYFPAFVLDQTFEEPWDFTLPTPGIVTPQVAPWAD